MISLSEVVKYYTLIYKQYIINFFSVFLCSLFNLN